MKIDDIQQVLRACTISSINRTSSQGLRYMVRCWSVFCADADVSGRDMLVFHKSKRQKPEETDAISITEQNVTAKIDTIQT
eukprot:gene27243-biopygen7700